MVIEVVDLVTFDTPTEPCRVVFLSPTRGGPRITDIRQRLSPHGCVRFSGTSNRTFVDFTPGDVEPPRIALDTIARSDAAGLERMLLSVLPYVDEIVLGLDGRSDTKTIEMATHYADCVFVFAHTDLDLTDDEWNANKINFAAARNLGRSRVHAPWTLVLDTDEYLKTSVDLRLVVSAAPVTLGSFAPLVQLERDPGRTDFEQRDFQRLARTEYRWHQASHNQLAVTAVEHPRPIDARIISDTSLRSVAEQARRDSQRELGIDELIEEASKGNLNALFHVAKHRAGTGDLQEAVRLAEDFRSRVEPNSVLSYQRQWVALTVAFRYYYEDDSREANRWACRALLDGPSLPAFCLLGDLAEEDGDLPRARAWYEAACAVTDTNNIAWPGLLEVRHGRLAGIRRALDGLLATTLP